MDDQHFHQHCHREHLRGKGKQRNFSEDVYAVTKKLLFIFYIRTLRMHKYYLKSDFDVECSSATS